MNEHLCMGCMENKGDYQICPHCGYSENGPRIQSFLPPRSLIGNRYLVGKVLSYNGEGVTYIGFDTASDRKVTVREFFPDALVTRDDDGMTVKVKPNCQIQFKTYLSDFLEVNEKIGHLRSISCLVQILDITEDLGTVYAITELPVGETLEQYLQRRGMMLTWGEAYEMMLPIIKTMELVHEDGIIHRGISPSTIYIAPNGRAKLTGFGISAARAARTELAAELFAGFSAPEQYSSIAPHGTWTDIYAICAVLYFCVTGIAPPEALIRSPEAELIRPRERNETVPSRASAAIMQGLAIRPDDRIHTIDELIHRLTPARPAASDAPTVSIPAVTPPPRRPENRPADNSRSAPRSSQRPAQGHSQPVRSQPSNRNQRSVKRVDPKEAAKKKNRRLLLMTALVTLSILLLILIFTFWYLFGDRKQNDSYKDNIVSGSSSSLDVSEESSGFGNYTPPSSSGSTVEGNGGDKNLVDGRTMVNLVGRQLESVQKDEELQYITIAKDIEFVYSESADAGEIIWQDIAAGSPIESGTEVRIKVSRGSQYILIPDGTGKTEFQYAGMLDELMIPYTFEASFSDSVPEGFVIQTEPAFGSKYDVTGGKEVIVYISEN